MLFWNNPDVDYWYKQNIFLVIKDGVNNFGLQKESMPNDLIHLELFTLINNSKNEIYQQHIHLAWGEDSVARYARLLLKSILTKVRLLK